MRSKLVIFALLSFAVACNAPKTEISKSDDNERPTIQQFEETVAKVTKEDMEQFVSDLLSGVLRVNGAYLKDVAIYEDGVCIKNIGEKCPFNIEAGVFMLNDMIFYDDGTCHMCYQYVGCDCQGDKQHSWLYTKLSWECDMDTFTFTLTSERLTNEMLTKNKEYINATTKFSLLAYDKEKKICQLRGLMPTHINKNWEWIYVDVPIGDTALRASMENAFVDEDSTPCGKGGYCYPTPTDFPDK